MRHVKRVKGSDASVHQGTRLGPSLYLYYEEYNDAGLIDREINFEGKSEVECLIKMLCHMGYRHLPRNDEDAATSCIWVTPDSGDDIQPSIKQVYEHWPPSWPWRMAMYALLCA
jgi:hypothetical protein